MKSVLDNDYDHFKVDSDNFKVVSNHTQKTEFG